jgi:hypothetical protein
MTRAKCTEAGGSVVEAGECADARFVLEKDATVTDTETGISWQAYTTGLQSWSEAKAFCEGLGSAPVDKWRMPTIEELRSLVFGCSTTAAGGVCPIATGCGVGCMVQPCEGCGAFSGPGPGNSYLGAAFFENTGGSWSTATFDSNGDDMAFVLNVANGALQARATIGSFTARCVRGGQ